MVSRMLLSCARGPKSSISRTFATTTARQADFTHAIIGGGAVGLAIARRLAGRDGTSTVLVERNSSVGMETSSRNSEVIHAGLYYGAGSLKTKLCIQGREMMYALCDKSGIPYKKLGKWVVAQDERQWEELVKLHEFCREIGVPTRFISHQEAAEQEPFVRAQAGVLESPTTGIVDSHAYMQFLLGDFTEQGGDLAVNSTVTAIAPRDTGYEVTITDKASTETSTFTAETLINSAGLGACAINNMLLPAPRHLQPFYAKGSYFSYAAPRPTARHLIYPAPVPGHAGLGTHLTLDLDGRIRFGPDVEWVDDPDDLAVSDARLSRALADIRAYFPTVDPERIRPDYAGIRPKLGRASATVGGDGFRDFVIRVEDGFPGFVNLVGIESPGLTASLAIGELVEGLLYR
ncbi:MAG: hypothetical protein M1818_006212 [Claussenomyces sp. TS43310]|nr:MAG: hypothetical protein M1818_006212 [Claussenomyces sp. TS43310]